MQGGSNHLSDACDTNSFDADSFDTTIHLPCERAARIARDLGLPFEVSEAIYQSDEPWDRFESSLGIQSEEISLLARIIKFAQALDIAAERYGPAVAINLVSRRCSRWFDPEVSADANRLHEQLELWNGLQSPEILSYVMELAPEGYRQSPNIFLVDNICLAFAEIVDAKSPFTFSHSTGVARTAISVAEVMGVDRSNIKLLHRAALLHDIGKLGVPNVILEKAGKLTSWECTTSTNIPGTPERSSIKCQDLKRSLRSQRHIMKNSMGQVIHEDCARMSYRFLRGYLQSRTCTMHFRARVPIERSLEVRKCSR
nr:HD domain-containing phosphohydrolase [Granulicella sp. L60]